MEKLWKSDGLRLRKVHVHEDERLKLCRSKARLTREPVTN